MIIAILYIFAALEFDVGIVVLYGSQNEIVGALAYLVRFFLTKADAGTAPRLASSVPYSSKAPLSKAPRRIVAAFTGPGWWLAQAWPCSLGL